MILSLTDKQMYDLWRTAAGLEPAVSAASVERFDSVDISQQFYTAMRAWYIDYLATAPEHMVPVGDLGDYVRVTPTTRPGLWRLKVVCECARIVSVELEKHGVVRIFDSTVEAACEAWGNKFLRLGTTPWAVYTPGTKSMLLSVPDRAEPKVAEIRGVMIPEDDLYRVDERVLGQLPEIVRRYLPQLNIL